MAFGKHMAMMGGKSKLGKAPDADKGADKPAEKGDVSGDTDDSDSEPGTHMHIHHDGLSFKTSTKHEDGSEDAPEDHATLDEVKAKLDQLFGEGDQEQMPAHHAEPMMGGYGG
jgi:hypothetical protein